MLLSDRRHSLLYAALAGMEIGWVAPFALLAVSYWQRRLDPNLPADLTARATGDALAKVLAFPPAAAFFIIFFTMILYMLAADLLNRRQVDGMGRALAIVTLVVVTSLLAVRLLLYAGQPVGDLGWLRRTGSAVFNFTAGRRPETIILLLNAFLWFRVANLTERDLSFFGVSLSFRLGLLLAVAGGALLSGMAVQEVGSALLYFFFFTLFGLVAVALARMDEKALLVDGSRGSLLPWRQALQTAAVALITTLAGFALGVIYTPAAIRTVLGWFQPLWVLLRFILAGIVYVIAWILSPIIEQLYRFGLWLMSRLEPVTLEGTEPPPPLEIDIRPSDINALLDRSPTVRYLVVIVAIALALFLIWFFFLRTERRRIGADQEETEQARMTYGGGLFGRGWDRMRALFDLVRRYGFGANLLAAISIHNIYANITRLARQRGFPRPAAQPPDLYLPALQAAFPACADELERITAAYMRVEYGDQALDDLEMTELRADYRKVAETPAPAEPEPGTEDQGRPRPPNA